MQSYLSRIVTRTVLPLFGAENNASTLFQTHIISPKTFRLESTNRLQFVRNRLEKQKRLLCTEKPQGRTTKEIPFPFSSLKGRTKEEQEAFLKEWQQRWPIRLKEKSLTTAIVFPSWPAPTRQMEKLEGEYFNEGKYIKDCSAAVHSLLYLYNDAKMDEIQPLVSDTAMHKLKRYKSIEQITNTKLLIYILSRIWLERTSFTIDPKDGKEYILIQTRHCGLGEFVTPTTQEDDNNIREVSLLCEWKGALPVISEATRKRREAEEKDSNFMKLLKTLFLPPRIVTEKYYRWKHGIANHDYHWILNDIKVELQPVKPNTMKK